MTTPETHYRDLLPSFLSHQAWLDLCDVMEEVFDGDVVAYRKALQQIRAAYFPVDETVIAERELLEESSFDTFDAITNRYRLSHLGLKLRDASIMSDASLVRLSRTVGAYWHDKGRSTAMDYLSYVLDMPVNVTPLWTQDYVTFYGENDGNVGTPVWEGGTWYPTTHIRIAFDSSRIGTNQVPVLIQTFYDVAGYNLILESVTTDTFTFIISVDVPNTDYTTGDIPVGSPVIHLSSYNHRSDYITSA